MISVFWRPLSVPSDHASISRNALRWLLISTIFSTPAFLAAKTSEPPASTDVADKHACYMLRLLLSPAKSTVVTNELGDVEKYRRAWLLFL